MIDMIPLFNNGNSNRVQKNKGKRHIRFTNDL